MLSQMEQRHTFKKLDEYSRNAYRISDYQLKNERFVIFSDAHKGDYRDTVDEFKQNESLYCDALNYYLNEDYGLILNGDMEEGWKNRYDDIVQTYENSVYRLESEFAKQGERRYLKIWGNHDADWMKPDNVKKYLWGALKRKVNVHPAVILGDKIVITHGHQGDPNGDTTAGFSEWVVRYLWQPIQWAFDWERRIGITMNTAWRRREKHLYSWAKAHHLLLIAGHTHRPMFYPDTAVDPSPRITPCYLNSGSCLSHEGITGIEIDRGEVRMVKWNKNTSTVERSIFHHADLALMLAAV